MLTWLLLSTVPVSAAALLNARREYRRRGRLTSFGLFLLCLMLFLPNLVIEYATVYRLPDTLPGYFGVALAGAGLALCLGSILDFRSPAKVLCLDAGELTLAGFYRFSRNPQYLGWVLFLLGFTLTDWSLWCLGALLVVAVSLHLLVLIEEEHLRRVFGQAYEEFCSRVPRYLALGRVQI